MSLTVSPTQDDINTALRSFLISVLPAGVDAIIGQQNRVPEPSSPNFAIFTCIRRRRIATNIDSFNDCRFTASISGTSMVVTAVDAGVIIPDAVLFGVAVAAGTAVVSGPGGVGVYVVKPAQSLPATTLSAGQATYTQQTEVVFQIDVHSASVTDSGDMAQVITTMFRDDYATQFFAAINPAIVPLLADDPRQLMFDNAEMQFETRWIIEARLQANQIVSGVPAEFADSAALTVVDIDTLVPGP